MSHSYYPCYSRKPLSIFGIGEGQQGEQRQQPNSRKKDSGVGTSMWHDCSHGVGQQQKNRRERTGGLRCSPKLLVWSGRTTTAKRTQRNGQAGWVAVGNYLLRGLAQGI